jgi:hypothetical protein
MSETVGISMIQLEVSTMDIRNFEDLCKQCFLIATKAGNHLCVGGK